MEKKSAITVFREDEVIVREGDSCGEMFKIISGNAALYLRYGEENEYLIGGAVCGKMLRRGFPAGGKAQPLHRRCSGRGNDNACFRGAV